MGRKARKRRQSHGPAWLWKQTDCWYYTQPGTKKRVAIFDENGERIRGKENKEAAEVSLAREKLTWGEEVGVANGLWQGSARSICDTASVVWQPNLSARAIGRTQSRFSMTCAGFAERYRWRS